MTQEQPESLLGNILAIAGLIIVLFIGLWGLAHLVSISKDFFSGIFARSAVTIQISSPKTAIAGEPILVTWTYTPTSTGSYSFLYACKPGFQFATPDKNGVLVKIPCGAPFAVASSTRGISLIPSLDASASAPTTVPISVVFTAGGAATQAFGSTASPARVEGTASIAVSHGTTPVATNTTSKPQTSSPTKTTPVKTAAAKSTSPADLSVRIISADAGVIVFDIKNIGGRSTGSYYFTVELPTNGAYAYTSPLQHSLAPGSHVVSTLTYDDIAPQGGTATVTVDPDNRVPESRSSNNTASTQMFGYAY